jgi:hypothetical protein
VTLIARCRSSVERKHAFRQDLKLLRE